MTRLYSSFDLDRILADDLAKKEREKRERDAAVRKERIDALRSENDSRTDYEWNPDDDVDGALAQVPGPLRKLDLSHFRLGMHGDEFHLFGLPMGNLFDNLAMTRLFLAGGAHQLQESWKEWDSRSQLGTVYSLPDGREFEAIVEAVAAYHPQDSAQQRILSLIKQEIRFDLSTRIMTSTRVGIVDTGLDMISHNYGTKAYKLFDLKGAPLEIGIDPECDAALAALLDTTAARYCAARDALGVPRGMLYRRPGVPSTEEFPLVMGKDLSIMADDNHAARGLRRLDVAELRGRDA